MKEEWKKGKRGKRRIERMKKGTYKNGSGHDKWIKEEKEKVVYVGLGKKSKQE